MKIYRKYKTDTVAEQEGAWVDIGDGARIKVARWRNKNHVKVLAELQEPYKDQLRAGVPLEDSLLKELACKAMSEAIVLDWEGLKDDSGDLIPYNKSVCFEVLLELDDFRDDIATVSDNRATFNLYLIEQAKKN